MHLFGYFTAGKQYFFQVISNKAAGEKKTDETV
jgi:hypothetical protein